MDTPSTSAARGTLAYAEPALTQEDRSRRASFYVRSVLRGWRQIGFACGLAFVLGGAGYAIGDATNTNSETPCCMAFGGFLIGISIPLRR